ncbi:MAG: hypothetical protein IH914_06350 [candidate division Zixibacteria bacterium]|nr:hypothetical protein [candidate division Zixibacteria bacterium]
MKRFTTSLALVFALVFAFGALNAAEESAWFDMENCGMCAPMTAEKGLMENINWENHNISNGMLSIATPPAEYAEAFDRACASMDALVKKMMAGDVMEMTLCGHCNSYSSIMGAGAKIEKIVTKNGRLTLLTSSDEKIVGKIHAHVERTNAEMAKMMEAMTKESGHEGHAHD